VVEAIEDAGLQMQRGWDLSNWRYEFVPSGVRFAYQDGPWKAEVVAKLDLRRAVRETSLPV